MKVKDIVKLLAILFVAAWFGCSTAGPKKTEPSTPEPAVSPPRLDLPADSTIYRALSVIEEFGRQDQQHISYQEYRKRTGGKSDNVSSWSPDWFYDAYVLEMNEKGYWATVTFYTARDAVKRDERINRLMEGVPVNAIDMKLKFPGGENYLLSDTEADGVLDFVRKMDPHSGRTDDRQTLEQLEQLQKKYSWILGIIKRSYRRTGK